MSNVVGLSGEAIILLTEVSTDDYDPVRDGRRPLTAVVDAALDDPKAVSLAIKVGTDCPCQCMLTPDAARELAKALLKAADVVGR